VPEELHEALRRRAIADGDRGAAGDRLTAQRVTTTLPVTLRS
jgi:hypothetical protein